MSTEELKKACEKKWLDSHGWPLDAEPMNVQFAAYFSYARAYEDGYRAGFRAASGEVEQ